MQSAVDPLGIGRSVTALRQTLGRAAVLGRQTEATTLAGVARVTLADVAARAGVSRATASLVLRQEGRVSPETRKRVQAALAEVGYVYNRGAASLRERRSGMVGLLVTDLANPFFAEMAVGFEEALADQASFTLIANTFDDADRQHTLLRSMVEHGVDAVAVVPVETSAGPVDIQSSGVPALAVTRRPSHGPYLGPDDDLAGRLAARHLLELGVRTVAYLGGPAHGSVRAVRVAAVRDELAAVGARIVHDLPGRTSLDTGMQLADQWLALSGEVDAVIGHSDVVVLGIAAAMRIKGLDPSAIPMVGFDGLSLGVMAAPGLTTVTVGPGELGRQAARSTLALAGGEPIPAEQLLAPRVFTWGAGTVPSASSAPRMSEPG